MANISGLAAVSGDGNVLASSGGIPESAARSGLINYGGGRQRRRRRLCERGATRRQALPPLLCSD